MSWIEPSVRALSGPVLTTVSRHFQSSEFSSTPRFRVMFDHFVAPGTLRTNGSPLSSTDICSMTLVSESRPEHSRNMPTDSLPPRSRRKWDAVRGSLAGIYSLLLVLDGPGVTPRP